ncbi:MAG: cell division protein ZapA [Microscillaceae bacterium]|nr:cell division protein ZapA [Microscillaceae bacterium]
MMNQKLSIKIKIADRDYPMHTEQSMESKLRKAGSMINQKLKYFSKHLGVQDKQDLLAMAAFDCMVDLLTLQENTQKSQALLKNKISSIDEMISS